MRVGSLRSSRRWTIAIIRKVFNVSWDLWSHRKNSLRNPNARHLQRQHASVNEAIAEQFACGCVTWRRSDQKWFRRPLHRRLDDDLESKQLWLRTVTTIRAEYGDPDDDSQFAAEVLGMHTLHTFFSSATT